MSRRPVEPGAPKLLDRVRQTIRAKHYSRRTETAYVDWIRRYILFHRKRHPSDMGASEITAFLTWPASNRGVSASTQNQALSALLFLHLRAVASNALFAANHLARGEPIGRGNIRAHRNIRLEFGACILRVWPRKDRTVYSKRSWADDGVV